MEINLKEIFNEINKICFNDSLPYISVKFGNTKKLGLGIDAAFVIDNFNNKSIIMNIKYKKDRHCAALVLMHEMVHYELALNGFLSIGHGKKFKSRLLKARKSWGSHSLIKLSNNK